MKKHKTLKHPLWLFVLLDQGGTEYITVEGECEGFAELTLLDWLESQGRKFNFKFCGTVEKQIKSKEFDESVLLKDKK